MSQPYDFLKINEKLAEQKAQNNFRQCPCIEERTATKIVIDHKEYINFASNDYLGLSTDPYVTNAWIEGLKKWGNGSGSSPLVIGLTSAHLELEETIKDWLGVEAVLFFNAGFAANQAIVKTFNNKNTTIYIDRLAHASLQEASLLSGAQLKRFLHNDASILKNKLVPNTGMIITEGVFSMDGDEAPLRELLELAQKTHNLLLVDDAHGMGVHGVEGRGTVNKQGLLHPDLTLFMGTFGKAIGTSGAFVAGSAELISYMTNFTREYIYSTFMPPATAYATTRSINLIRQDQGLRESLHRNIALFKEGLQSIGFSCSESQTAIQPIIIGSSEEVLNYNHTLKELGLYVPAIRPPTVPKNTARLRVSLTSKHTAEEIARLIEGLDKCRRIYQSK